MRHSWLVATYLICLTPGVNTYSRLKFRHWFPQYKDHWIGQAAECQEQLNAYFTNNRTVHPSPCASSADCLLANVTGTIESNFATATVVLGLVPGVLMLLAPTVAEIAALSTYRPWLAVLLAAGSPATYVTTLFQQVDAYEPYNRTTTRLLKRWTEWIRMGHPGTRASLTALYHLVAVLAVANNVYDSVVLDLRTICGWRCGALFLPLSWSLSGVLVHAPSIIAIRMPLKGSWRICRDYLIQSTTYRKMFITQTSVTTDMLFWIATLAAVIQLIFGILDLASLVFISTLEAVNVFSMYAASTLSCKAILLLELAEMRRDLDGYAVRMKTARDGGHRLRARTL